MSDGLTAAILAGLGRLEAGQERLGAAQDRLRDDLMARMDGHAPD